MSSKRQSTSKAPPPAPKLPAKEMIVTRHRSAQMKRQLRDKDRSMSHITQLLRSPSSMKNSKNTKGSPKNTLKVQTKTNKKSLEKKGPLLKRDRYGRFVNVTDSKEYYPNKVKRNVQPKKILLKPKHELKMIGGTYSTNKRKLGLPQKKTLSSAYINSPQTQRATATLNELEVIATTKNVQTAIHCELSMEERIKLIEDSQSLTDEDLIEILTCPSPVWWEEPIDGTYVEDAIFYRPSSSEHPVHITPTDENTARSTGEQREATSGMSKAVSVQTVIKPKPVYDTSVDSIEVLHKSMLRGDEFIKKRNKLENLLGNIKNKIQTNLDYSVTSGFSDKKPKKIKEISHRRLCVAKCENNVNNPKETVAIEDGSAKSSGKSRSSDVTDKVGSDKRSLSSTDCDEFLDSIHDDEVLTVLENIDIPIEGSISDEIDKDEAANVEEIVIDDVNECSNSNENKTNIFLGSNKDSTVDPVSNESTSVEYSPAPKKRRYIEVKQDKIDKETKVDLVKHLQKLTIINIEKDVLTSPSSKSVMSDDVGDSTSNFSNQEMIDTISDTNIRFLTDDETDEFNENNSYTNNDNVIINDTKSDQITDSVTENELVTSKNGNQFFLNVNNECVKSCDDRLISTGTDSFKLPDEIEFKDKSLVSNFFEINGNYNKGVIGKKDENTLKDKELRCNVDKKYTIEKDVSKKSIKHIDTYESKSNNSKSNKTSNLYTKNAKDNIDPNVEGVAIDEDDVNENNNTAFCDSCYTKKSIIVSDNKVVRYCMKCSCIFDTDECAYCNRSLDIEKKYLTLKSVNFKLAT